MASLDPADSYDRLPYPSQAFSHTAPERLAGMAFLHGLNPTPPSAARVLEVGCSSGGNLLPLAMENPDSQYIGIDVARGQIAEAQELAARLQVGNASFVRADLLDWEPEEPVDYIIAHGFYSWVPETVRSHLLELASSWLSEHGLLYVSYNALPGWHTRRALREMMLYHTQSIEDPLAKVEQARALLAFLSMHTGDQPWGRFLDEAHEHTKNRHDAFVFHDMLEADNEPFSLSELRDQATTAGLHYLGETDHSHLIEETIDPGVRAMLQPVAPDRFSLQQLQDFISVGTFHSSVLCCTEPSSGPLPERMAQMHIASLGDKTYPDPRLAALLGAIREIRPLTMPVGDLPEVDGRDELLLGLCARRHAELLTEPCSLPRSTGEFPEVTPWIRWQVSEHQRLLTDRRHQTLGSDHLDHVLLPLCDGTRTRAELATAVEERTQKVSSSSSETALSKAEKSAAIVTAIDDKLTDYVRQAMVL